MPDEEVAHAVRAEFFPNPIWSESLPPSGVIHSCSRPPFTVMFPTVTDAISLACVFGTQHGAGATRRIPERKNHMLWTLIGVLLLLWVLGLATSFGGGLIHLLLVLAVIVLVIRLITGRRVV